MKRYRVLFPGPVENGPKSTLIISNAQFAIEHPQRHFIWCASGLVCVAQYCQSLNADTATIFEATTFATYEQALRAVTMMRDAIAYQAPEVNSNLWLRLAHASILEETLWKQGTTGESIMFKLTGAEWQFSISNGGGIKILWTNQSQRPGEWQVLWHGGNDGCYGSTAAAALREAADRAPGCYRDALLTAAEDPPNVPHVVETTEMPPEMPPEMPWEMLRQMPWEMP